MNILIKVAQNNSIIRFKIYNHNVYRAVTYNELERLVNKGKYDLVLLEEIESSKVSVIKGIVSKVRTALVCGRALEYAPQVDIANDIGIDVITQAEELDDYISTLFGVGVKFRDNTSIIESTNVLDDTKGINVETNTDKDNIVDISAETNKDKDNSVDIGVETNKDKDNLVDISVETNKDKDNLSNNVVLEFSKFTSEEVSSHKLWNITIKGINEGYIHEEVSRNISETDNKYELEIISLNNKITEITNKCKELEDDTVQLTERLRASERNKNELQDKVDELNRYIRSNSDESVLSDRNALSDALHTANNKIVDLNLSVSKLRDQISKEKESMLVKLKESNTDLSLTLSKYNNLVSDIMGIKVVLVECLKLVNSENDLTIDGVGVNEVVSGIRELCLKFKGIVGEISSLKVGVDGYRSTIKKDEEQLRVQSEKIQLLNEKIVVYEQSLADKDITIIQQKSEISGFETTKAVEFDNLNSDIRIKNLELETLNKKVINLSEGLKVKEDYIKKLTQEIVKYSTEKASMQASIDKLNYDIKNTKVSVGVEDVGIVSMNHGYNGKAKIINVFGSGSYGVTTMCMTLVHKFVGKRVLYMDMDLVSPKADSWFRVNPVCDKLTDVENELDRTGVAVLIDKGTSYALSNIAKIVKRMVRQRGYVLDYFSGVYNTPKTNKIYQVDYTTLFNFLGDKYDYIVVDSGRLGSSDAYDSVIKTISDMAYRNVIITSCDAFDIRNQKVKIECVGIDETKSLWVMNMGDNSVISSDIKSLIGKMRTIKITLVMGYYGIKKPMDLVVANTVEKINTIYKCVV